MDRDGLARQIYERTHLTGEFTLRSGAISNEYFDKYLFESDPALFERPKSGFVLPFDRWIRQGLKKAMDQTMRDPQAIAAEIDKWTS